MKKIVFATKEENNLRREKEFLALTPSQRFMQFLRMVSSVNQFETRATGESRGNFVVEKNDSKL